VKEIWRSLEKKSKNFTEHGKKRKVRLTQRVFYEEKKTLLTLNCYVSVLPMLKEYVVLFQTKAPLVHKLHDRHEGVFRDFLACYVKPEVLVNKDGNLTGPQMKRLNLKSDGTERPSNSMFLSQPFVGPKAKDIMTETGRKDSVIVKFQERVSQGYKDCGSYLQMKLPLDSTTLRSLSCLDPAARGHHLTLKLLKE
jgi:hypothetical protein